ncbi:YidH family protein [Pseudoxanthomonas indica]|uniref:Putative membrane protein n=1 Tax=Pseudoxanthomonas indica TaxID=428993 RepID=A0A1T5LXY0_9GAMM|nr:DUF202 domain-containing protein [Pseudoxanthomonas indica]GGD42086.1 hypothetical protein GCM10007235_12690 [Pseudoxanthomonas indica]SKC80821.1 putative membrane protein [Pseudoxanthomonas indica]
MNTPEDPKRPADNPHLANDLARGRTHMANERTHLAYLRTTVSLIGFGITINRFSMYLVQNNAAPEGKLLLRDAGNAGLGMVILGLALLVWSLFRYWKVTKDIDAGVSESGHKATLGFSIGLLVLGGITALWLFLPH